MIGERLSELRQSKGMSQQELADKLRVSVNAISSYERDRSFPDDEIKKRIASFFNISVDYLIGLTNNRIPVNNAKSSIILLRNLPDNAMAELENFLKVLKNKYRC